MKVCAGCGEEKGSEEFGVNRALDDGLTIYCRVCTRAKAKQYRIASGKQKPPGWVRKTQDRLAYHREYSRAHRRPRTDADREYEKAWRAAHKDKLKVQDRARYERKQREIHGPDWKPRPRVVLPPEERPARLKAKQRAAYLKRKELHPEIIRARYAARHARHRSNGIAGTFTRQELLDLIEQQKGLCALCSVDIRQKYHVDHKTPLSRGGSNLIGNIQVLCPTCNTKKGARIA